MKTSIFALFLSLVFKSFLFAQLTDNTKREGDLTDHVKAQADLTDRTNTLKKVRIPTMVMHGAEDYAVDTYGGIQTAGAINNAELVIIPENGAYPI